jgi:heme-degrading monooxygenase HmoA
MTAFNIVRFRVKKGQEQKFIDYHKRQDPTFKGFRRLAIVKTGEGAYCFLGEWDSYESIVAARPQMIAQLDEMRDLLEDLGGGLGVTDPVSGEVVVDLKP